MLETQTRDGVRIVTMASAPVNALSTALRKALAQQVETAVADASIQAIVLTGTGRTFSAGADISEFGGAMMELPLPELFAMIESSEKPVIAAINGTALGGGLEVALGCHYRLAADSAKVGLPEVKLGLLPGAGGTQRLPRLTGLAQAAAMIASGDPISAAKAKEAGIVDAVVADDKLLDEAVAFARTAKPGRRTRDLNVPGEALDSEALRQTLSAKAMQLDAPKACVEAVAASAKLPFDEGMALEARLFQELVGGEQSRALRHVFFAERAAAKIADIPADCSARPVRSVGVIGAGTMGGGIAMNFLSAGIPVTIVETSSAALENGVGVIRRNYEATAAKGRIAPEAVERAMALLTPTLDFAALAQCDLIIEAVYEDMAVKKEIFGRLDGVAKPGAILASNTSFLSIDEIAAATKRPQDVLGMHFFSPANVMKLLEVVRGAATAPDALVTAMELARKIGKVAVVAGVCYGFIGNRMLLPRQTNAEAMLLEGAQPQQIDEIHTDFGMPMGPFQMSDLAGVDIGWHRDASRTDTLQEALCAKGRWGQKTKAGYYDYDEKRRPSASAVTSEIVADLRARNGIQPRTIDSEEIVARTLDIMVNEGAKILEEGIAQRASDIDVVWIYGYGWPRHKGGPMFWADQEGLATIVGRLERYAQNMAGGLTISPLLRQRAAEGRPLGEQA